jgi:hypothetical protein
VDNTFLWIKHSPSRASTSVRRSRSADRGIDWVRLDMIERERCPSEAVWEFGTLLAHIYARAAT